jgi:hypothetical protein
MDPSNSRLAAFLAELRRSGPQIDPSRRPGTVPGGGATPHSTGPHATRPQSERVAWDLECAREDSNL